MAHEKTVGEAQFDVSEIGRVLCSDFAGADQVALSSIIPVLEKLEIDSVLLLRGFANSHKQQIKARSLGLTSKEVDALIEKYKQSRMQFSFLGVDICVVNDVTLRVWKRTLKNLTRRSSTSPAKLKSTSKLFPSIKNITVMVFAIFVLMYTIELFILETESNAFRESIERHSDYIGNPYQHHICNATSYSVANLRLREGGIDQDKRIGLYSYSSSSNGEDGTGFSPRVDLEEIKLHENGILCIKEHSDVKPSVHSIAWEDQFLKEIDWLMHGLYHAHNRKRTLVAPSLISSLYDVQKLGRSMYPTWKTAVVLPYSENLCGDAKNVASLNNGTIYLDFDELDVPDFIFIRSFHQYLVPTGTIEAIIKGYIYENFGLSHYAAVWLVDDVHNCKKKTLSLSGAESLLCSPSKGVVDTIMRQLIPESPVPLFVFTRTQNKVPDSFHHDYHLEVPCPPYACAMIKHEVAARANLFIGPQPDNTSTFVSRLRLTRQLRSGVFYPNILRWNNDELLTEKSEPYYRTWFNVSGERNGLWKGKPELFEFDDEGDINS